MTPTEEQFNAFQQLFTYYNTGLFEGRLPEVFLNFSRKQGAAGFFSYGRWKYIDGAKVHEISINPATLAEGKLEQIQTLVHEMVHLWQNEFGTPGRRGYHNQQFADKMESVGLMPSDTGAPGGKRTGERMSDYIIENGPLDRLLKDMPQNHLLPLTAIEATQGRITSTHHPLGSTTIALEQEAALPGIEEVPEDPKKKIKYSCPICNMNVWGKPGLYVICGEHEIRLEVQ